MMPNYENETCEGCVWFMKRRNTSSDDECQLNEGKPLKTHLMYGNDHCPEFTPSLECRKVRALEHIAKSFQDGPKGAWLEVSTE
jgi:hypothetical protein